MRVRVTGELVKKARQQKAQKKARRAERIARYRKGRFSELAAAICLTIKGYRILQWRARTTAGEIDLIAVRGNRVAFVEVKYRRTIAAAQSAISVRQQHRLIRAADVWISRRPRYRNFERGMDAIFITPRSWPRHEKNVFYFD